jgi:hypothetical protein
VLPGVTWGAKERDYRPFGICSEQVRACLGSGNRRPASGPGVIRGGLRNPIFAGAAARAQSTPSPPARGFNPCDYRNVTSGATCRSLRHHRVFAHSNETGRKLPEWGRRQRKSITGQHGNDSVGRSYQRTILTGRANKWVTVLAEVINRMIPIEL